MNDGLSLLELSDLPGSWRTIIRLLMRKQPQTYASLAAATAALPGQQQLVGECLDAALDELRENGYIVQEGAGEDRSYLMRIARKSGRTMSNDLWNALDSGDASGDDKKPTPRRARSDLFGKLG